MKAIKAVLIMMVVAAIVAAAFVLFRESREQAPAEPTVVAEEVAEEPEAGGLTDGSET